MKLIQTRKQFIRLAQQLGVRDDWHEPDEQGVNVVVKGRSFDNAFGAYGGRLDNSQEGPLEKVVIFTRNSKPVGQVNLASLCAWAAGTDN